MGGKEHNQGHAQVDVQPAGRGNQTRDQSHQVPKKDEHEKHEKKREKEGRVFSDQWLGHVLDELHDHFHEILYAGRNQFYVGTGPPHEEKHDAKGQEGNRIRIYKIFKTQEFEKVERDKDGILSLLHKSLPLNRLKKSRKVGVEKAG
jgi:hypothetical protein